MESYQKAVYKDPRWAYVRKAVIARDRDICYFCHKLILRKRTIHHIIEIDETNYSDPQIAFNLDNLVECHNSCHDRYHERFANVQKQTIVDDDLEIDYQKRKERDEAKNSISKL